MKRLAKIVVAIFIYVYQIDHTAAEQWLYLDPLKPNEFFSIETEPDSAGMFDIRYPAKYCKSDNEFICIKSFDFEFYVPRNLSRSDGTWNIEGVEYKVAMKKNIMLFGIKDVLYYIDKSDNGGILRFLYSTSRGLVGMGGFSKNSSAIFLLDVKCGYGAPSKCSNQ